MSYDVAALLRAGAACLGSDCTRDLKKHDYLAEAEAAIANLDAARPDQVAECEAFAACFGLSAEATAALIAWKVDGTAALIAWKVTGAGW